MEHLPGFEYVMALVTGACAGSFVSAASHRLPHGQDIAVKPSHCPRCETPLRAIDLIPVLSWSMLKGKCRYCGEKISPRYPLIEVTTALLFLLIYVQFGLTAMGGVMALFITFLMILIVTDLEHFIIPDSMQVALGLLAMAYHYVGDHDWTGMLAGGAAGLTLGLVLRYGYLYLRKLDALGLGDVKFLLVAGAWLGAGPFVIFLFLSGVAGTILGLLWTRLRFGQKFPFGPALALSLFVCVTQRSALENISWLSNFYAFCSNAM